MGRGLTPNQPRDPAFVFTSRTADRSCPICSARLEAATGVSLDAADPCPILTVDAVTVCAYCKSILVVTTIGFRLATNADLDTLDTRLKQLVFAYVQTGAQPT